ncbi:CRISPR-associated protein Cas1 [Deinobacterium chartae]|uniref:CRISPR-associated endonuclease Cas1 n=1 Tax=Deinobacterium chartae TaxID=521158 RepID=A0A841I2V6_9DEIO|nr:type I-E CRISPR-associated endonuclease Cas1e [Deinobacterium chartae]MBB6100007.1 CRISPR-associated protein Cas1 [Deinobacterium chartae]
MTSESQRIIWTRQNLRELPKFRDGLSYLYLEHARLEVQERAITCLQPRGAVDIPVAALGVLLLGPGTTVTHAAIKALADGGCTVLWVGEDSTRLYAGGLGETRSSARLQRQVLLWAHETSRLRVVRAMYALRFGHSVPGHLTLRQIRGMEGARVRDAYARASRESGVPWSGRTYRRNNWGADPINRALSAGNTCLYGLAHAAILSGGYSPALGFIHTGRQLSFVYDIADLYKTDYVVPAAFEAVSELPESIESRVRTLLRARITRTRLLERMVSDLHALMDADPNEDETDAADPGELWDPDGNVPGGVAYDGDRPGERADEPER